MWTKQIFEPHFETALKTKSNTVVFSDRSQVYKSRQFKSAKFINRKISADAATIVEFYDNLSKNNSIIIKRAIAIGRAILYDVEMMAFAMEISIAAVKSKDYTEFIFIFADNLSALYTIMNPKKGASQIRMV